MKNSFDLDELLHGCMRAYGIQNVINGGIYYSDSRPSDSQKEDIVINTITLTQDFLPQIGTSNINCYVQDKMIKVNGKHQNVPDRIRLKKISEEVVKAVKSFKVIGLKAIVEASSALNEAQVQQHFINIRISWNIQID